MVINASLTLLNLSFQYQTRVALTQHFNKAQTLLNRNFFCNSSVILMFNYTSTKISMTEHNEFTCRVNTSPWIRDANLNKDIKNPLLHFMLYVCMHEWYLRNKKDTCLYPPIEYLVWGPGCPQQRMQQARSFQLYFRNWHSLKGRHRGWHGKKKPVGKRKGILDTTESQVGQLRVCASS